MGRETLFAMPSSSILLVFSVALGFSNALPWAEAEQTATYTPHEWSPRPTGAPHAPAELFKRDSVGVDVCGWIGGDKGKAVTCDAGSSCVHDTLHVLVGCCTTDGPCTNGVYTTCQDKNSPGWAPSASIANNGVLTCSSSAACYQNTYPGDYRQWACGDSTQGTSLVTSYNGQPTDMRLQVVYTGVVFSPMPAKPSSSSAAILVDPSAAPPVPSSATTPTPAAFGKVAPTLGGDSSTSTPAPVAKSNTGAVVGGAVAAVAGVAMIAAIGFWLLRRRQRNQKQRMAGSYLGGRGISPPVLQGHSFSSQPFQPVRSESPGPAPENWVSPMTGHPANAPTRSIFPPASETAYHGSGGAGGLVNIDIDDASSHHSSRHSPRSLAHGFNDPSPQPPPTQTFANVAPPQASPAQYSPPPPSQFPQFSPPRPASQPYFPPPPEHRQVAREQAIPLVNRGQASEIDDFSRNWNNVVAQHDPMDRDTHIHTGTLPDTRAGMGVGVGVPLRKAVPQMVGGQGRVIDREARSEALREMGRSENVRMEGWSPRRLRTVRDRAESVASGRASPAFSNRSAEKEMEIPPKSPLRQERRMSFGLNNAISNAVATSAGGRRQQYQLVDEVMGPRRRNDLEVPVLNSPGGLRVERQRQQKHTYDGL